MKPWIKDLDREAFKSGVYSQSYQDELLSIIFANVEVKNPVPYCVEFGFSSTTLSDGTGANTARLILDNNWDSLLLDIENENLEINLHRHFLKSSNIAEVFKQHQVPEEPEYISIDVDSTDLWIFDVLLKEYRAMVFTVEYNSHYPLGAAITFPNDPMEKWEGDRGYGASLKALNMVATKHGYSLLWVVPPFDAFFIRNDLIDDGSGNICFPLEKWAKCAKIVCHKPLKNKNKARVFIDYEVYLRTEGDVEMSRRSAYPICRKYLTANLSDSISSFLKSMLPRKVKIFLKKLF